MPRDIGTSTGVNEMVDVGAAGRDAGSARSRGCAGACRRRRTGWRSRGSRWPSRFGLQRSCPRPEGPTASTDDEVVGLDRRPRGCRGRAPRVMAVTLQPGTAMRVAPTSCVALPCRRPRAAARAGRRSRRRSSRRRRTPPSRLARSSRWSAPQSTTRVSSGELGGELARTRRAAARGRRRRGPASICGVVSAAASRCASERRCGCTRSSGWPAFGVRGDGGDLELGMGGEQAQQLAARVAACAGNGDGETTCAQPYASRWDSRTRRRRRSDDLLTGIVSGADVA